MSDRYISAGLVMKLQDALMKGGVILGILGISVIPIFVYALTNSLQLTYGAMGTSVVLMLYIMLVSYLLESVRMNGLPLIRSSN